MSYIITDDRHYQAIGEALQRKRDEEKSYLPSEMAAAINTIPSAVDGTDLPVQAIYWTKPDETDRPTKCDIVNWHTDTPLAWSNILAQNGFTRISTVRFVNCDNISSISAKAFQNCTSLTSIELPNSVTSIGLNAFSNCSSLTSITLPNSVTNIEGYAFQNCTSLTSITLPNSVTSIGQNAFYNCTSLTSITIGNGVTSIRDYAFEYCTSLASITIPNSVTSIGWWAFYNCTSLKDVALPNSLSYVNPNAFQYSANIENIILGQDFNCSLTLSYSTKYSVDTMVAMFEALKDNTDTTAKTLTLGATNLAKLTAEQKQIATNKNWNLA